MQPMRLTLPTAECVPTSTASCGRHVGGPMLQIFSVTLARLSRTAAATVGSGPVELYGFMAVRDLMDPLRNYVFNRSRDDPLVIPDPRSDPFVHLPGPKRGVNMQARVMFEYDVRIKGGAEEYKDLPLIDEVAVFSEKTCIDEPAAWRIRGDRGGAVDVCWARLTGAVEATVDVRIHELAPPPPQHHRNGGGGGGGVDLSVSGFVPDITEEIKLFRGVVAKPCALDRILVAVRLDSDLILQFSVPDGDGSGSFHDVGKFAFRSTAHGSVSDCRRFSFGTVEVRVTWSALY
ncbi:hypothetical protein C2845_PM05G02250 [Panicum miliaceum]|uniref:DUF6598 domain-containing protein n=1 Tax=Panicum miliaceum TaxID=4540 RepID=A0A3L6T2J0_PANMI|nr:hypothetical protein C2845_PM05G02250 [Panicum miliaceum]